MELGTNRDLYPGVDEVRCWMMMIIDDDKSVLILKGVLVPGHYLSIIYLDIQVSTGLRLLLQWCQSDRTLLW